MEAKAAASRTGDTPDAAGDSEIPDGSTANKTERLSAILRDQISSGQLAPAAVLPSERQLISVYGVSRITVRAAIAALRSEGLVQVIPGKGAFVRRAGDWPVHIHARTITVDGDGNYVDNESSAGEWHEIEPLHKYRTDADAPLALALGVAQGTSFYASDRLLENNIGTRIFVRTYLPAFVTREIRKLARHPYISARQVYRAAREAGMEPEFNDYITARSPSPDDARKLRISDGTPMLVTRRIAAYNERPLVMQETRRSAEDTQLHYRPGA
ncbi:GntR family transcriptional regulator [Kribbella sp. VKM Ac-2527]|uniref:GntR family transcriptional regulator n=1 Tax=Kribbella caucasensis TaxID=2512215 RepID=A0A4R6KJR4_9ACTN|nr:GntR family transcriptional regulator [Kribbella sp. VKM Ac-2527]TDO51554.1 GntR family transcriptional regulator [Kribbella sp. VKM Ac-2527]